MIYKKVWCKKPVIFHIYDCTSQQVTFSSLDVHLHTEALLNTMNFLNNLLPPPAKKEGKQEELPTIPEADETEKEEGKKTETTVSRRKSKSPLWNLSVFFYILWLNLLDFIHYFHKMP